MRRSALLTCVLVGIAAQCGFALAQQIEFAMTQGNQPSDTTIVAEVAQQSGVGASASNGFGGSFPKCSPSTLLGPARISGGVIARNRISFVPPVYPRAAKRAKLSGTVVLRAIISKTGKIESLKVMSTTNPIFNKASIDAVRQWRYKPYLLNCNPAEVDTTIMVNYRP